MPRDRKREQQPLDRHERVPRLGRDRLRGVEQPHRIIVPVGRLRPRSAHRRDLRQRPVNLGERRLRLAPSRADQPRRHPLLVLEQRFEQMLGRHPLMVHADRNGLRRLEKPLGALGIFVDVHDAEVARRFGHARPTWASPSGKHRDRV